MSTLSDAVIPAAAALAGVVLSQAWSFFQERLRQRDQIRQLIWVERKTSLVNFLVALNQAIDATRKIVLTSRSTREIKRRDRESEIYWATAFERYMECSIYFPNEAVALVWKQLQDAYSFRRATIEAEKEQQAPAHEDLIFAIRPLLQLGEIEENPPFLLKPPKFEHQYMRRFSRGPGSHSRFPGTGRSQSNSDALHARQ